MYEVLRSLRFRLVVWFTLGVLAVTTVFCVVTYHHLYEELHDKKAAFDYPTHPDWKLHGSSSDGEIQDIMNELIEGASLYVLPFLGVILIIGYFLASQSLKPIAELNRQMARVTEATIHEPIHSSARDTEFQSLTAHLNDLLGRLGKSIGDIREYAAQIAHELRTPLTILRLKVEQADQKIAPEVQEELQDELHRLTQMVDHSLLIARSEKGTLTWKTGIVDASALVNDLVEDFDLLAQERDRSLVAFTSEHTEVSADPAFLKQILHGLFTNALKHGVGPITARLCPKQNGKMVHFLIVNRVAASPADAGLGLGLRVVRALISLNSGVHFQKHHGRQYYAARLIIPVG